jgi:hypothetical protein
MRKLISFLALTVLVVLALTSCAVNSYTGSISVINQTTFDCTSAKVGNVNIGFVGKGQTVTVYFSQAATGAIVTATGFDPSPSTLAGKIDLNLNFQYVMQLQKDNTTGKYIYYMNGWRIENSGAPADSVTLK